MIPNKFTEEDLKKFVEFINFIAKRADFSSSGWKTEDSITHFRLLAHVQQVIIPKIEANIFEVGEIKQMTPPAETAKPKEG